MSRVSLTINGQSYEVACEDGEEPRLRELAVYVDGKMSELRSSLGDVADARLFLMSSLVLADELFESRDRIRAADESPARESLVRSLNGVAGQMERLAERMEDA